MSCHSLWNFSNVLHWRCHPFLFAGKKKPVAPKEKPPATLHSLKSLPVSEGRGQSIVVARRYLLSEALFYCGSDSNSAVRRYGNDKPIRFVSYLSRNLIPDTGRLFGAAVPLMAGEAVPVLNQEPHTLEALRFFTFKICTAKRDLHWQPISR